MFLLQNTFIYEIRLFTFRNSFLICLTDVFRQHAKQVTCITHGYKTFTSDEAELRRLLGPQRWDHRLSQNNGNLPTYIV